MTDHLRSAVEDFRVIFHERMPMNEAQILGGHKANLLFHGNHDVLGLRWPRVAWGFHGMESANVIPRKFPLGCDPQATPHPRWNATPFESPTGRISSNLEEKRKVFTLFRIRVNAWK
jgi:hypothetical protein